MLGVPGRGWHLLAQMHPRRGDWSPASAPRPMTLEHGWRPSPACSPSSPSRRPSCSSPNCLFAESSVAERVQSIARTFVTPKPWPPMKAALDHRCRRHRWLGYRTNPARSACAHASDPYGGHRGARVRRGSQRVAACTERSSQRSVLNRIAGNFSGPRVSVSKRTSTLPAPHLCLPWSPRGDCAARCGNGWRYCRPGNTGCWSLGDWFARCHDCGGRDTAVGPRMESRDVGGGVPV